MKNLVIGYKMEGDKYNKDGTAKIEIIKNVYTIPEGLLKEEIIIKRTLIKSNSKEIQETLY